MVEGIECLDPELAMVVGLAAATGAGRPENAVAIVVICETP